jgi:ligand-binding sensor domain-containing protein
MNRYIKYKSDSACIKILIFILFTIYFNQIYSQESKLVFDYISMKNGLPSNKVNCIAKDSFGFYWYGTIDGLVRTDGTNMEVFQNNPYLKNSIPQGEIKSIQVDKTNRVWILTNDGHVFCYDYNLKGANPFRILNIIKSTKETLLTELLIDATDQYLLSITNEGEIFKILKSDFRCTKIIYKWKEISDFIKQPLSFFKNKGIIYIGTEHNLFSINYDFSFIKSYDIELKTKEKRINKSYAISSLQFFDDENILISIFRDHIQWDFCFQYQNIQN